MQRAIVPGALGSEIKAFTGRVPASHGADCMRRAATRTRAIPEGNSPVQSVVLDSQSVMEQLGKINSDAFWHSLPPHFGVKPLADRLSLVSLPELQAPQGLSDLASGLFQSGASRLQPLVQVADETRQGLANAQQSLFAELSNIFALQTVQVEPHFGSQYAAKTANALAAWLSSRLGSGGVGLDSEAAASLKSAVTSLTQISQSLPQLLPNVLATDVGERVRSTLDLAGPFFRKIEAGVPHPEALAELAAAVLTRVQTMGWAGVDPATLALVSAGVLAGVAISTPADDYEGPSPAPMPMLTPDFSPEALEAVYSRRPVTVSRRAAQVAAMAAQFGIALLIDIWTNRVKENEPQRARQVRGIIEDLGPAYVKVAQALSTRVDLLTPEYFAQIQLLQDRVPPFPCSEAYAVLEQTLGRPKSQVFQFISNRPIAAASLGQVYRGTLRPEYGGMDVAVKVLRPGVLDQVGLDLYIIRKIFISLQQITKTSTDWVGIIDNWAHRFFQEMDYLREAQNAVIWREQMQDLPGIIIPEAVPSLCSSNVLVTGWVEGEKLSESSASDVRELCNTLLNCYLIQLLETGFLHADPHPGNLIRTPDGKICILDFGLMTQVTEEQRLALVEYISHLITEDWENVTLDLQTMGFIPESIRDPKAAGLVEPIGAILSQLVGGGGATKVNIDKVMAEIEELGKKYPIVVPSFFALILRAFSVIEGIALGVDSEYAIVRECFPYLSRRLLSDPHPRVQKALRDVLYGKKQRLDVERLSRLADAFSAFTVEGLETPTRALQRTQGPLVDPSAREALRVVFDPRGSYVAELLVDELVAATDALSRDALGEVVRRVVGSPPALATLSALQGLGPLRSIILPLPTPIELLSRLGPVTALSTEDQEALGVVRGVFDLLQRLPPPALPTADDLSRVAAARGELVPLAQELAPGVFNIGQMFVRRFLGRVAARLANELGRPSRVSDYSADMAALGFMPLSPPSPSSSAMPSMGLRTTSFNGKPIGQRAEDPLASAVVDLAVEVLPVARVVLPQLARDAGTVATAMFLAPFALWGTMQSRSRR